MPRTSLFAVLLMPVVAMGAGGGGGGAAANPVVKLTTTAGEIEIELYPGKAPKTVENFLSYVRDGFYDGTIFHRVIKGFMIQGGGFEPGMQRKATVAPIENEADNGLPNDTGTIAMARTNDPNSATSQFFINTNDNANLNHRGKTPSGWGYAVFGRVISGMETVRAIESSATTTVGMHGDVPRNDVVITKAEIVR
jgi:peptidyl-prolyl cis-trans isomerase B (cyclophilin B)